MLVGGQLQVILSTKDPSAKRWHANRGSDQFLSISTGRTRVKRCIRRHFVNAKFLE
jgi:hypothetical protein